jgi:hypothetical protein
MKYFYPYFFFFCALVALVFLIYSIVNLDKIGIKITHPRVIVEAILFLIFSALGIYFLIMR